MKDINRAFSRMHKLSKLELSGNPLCQKSKYRDRVITMGSSIGMFTINGHYVIGKLNFYNSLLKLQIAPNSCQERDETPLSINIKKFINISTSQ